MRKLTGLVILTLIMMALAVPALAAPTYDPSTGRITDTYTGSGNAEYWVNGSPAGASRLNIIADPGATYSIGLYENGKQIGFWTVQAIAATTAPTAAPTEAPTTAPTEAPTAAPTEAPTTAPTTAPTAAPTETTTAAPTAAATTAPTATASSSSSSSSDIPKTGDGNWSITAIVAAMGIAAVTLIVNRLVHSR